MRADKKKSLSAVGKEMLKNPIAKLQDIANATGLSVGNVHDKLKELEKEWKKDDRIIQLTDEDFRMMKDIQTEKFWRLSESPEAINNGDLDKWENTAVRRYSLFRWSATNKEWWLNALSDKTDSELLNMINGIQ